MVTPPRSSWTVRGATFAVWLLAAASAVYWGLKLGAQPAASTVAPVAARPAPPIDPAAIARLLGGTATTAAAVAAPPPIASRLSLVGVVAGVRSHDGAAVISVDGKPAKPFRVGTSVEEGLVVLSVQGRQAALGPQRGGAPSVTLEVPMVKSSAGSPALPPPGPPPVPSVTPPPPPPPAGAPGMGPLPVR